VDRVTFYRQSDIPEIPELTWLLTCVAAKGLLNRAHAYKASVDKNVETGEDPDAGITMGLYSYPVLMAADILMFNAHKVPVGRDQIQHVEMARDIGQRFNHLFGQGKEFFTMPEALIEESVATLPGLDGRKMSKSYDNTIPLFTSAKEMKDAISRIVTDSRAPGEAKDPDNSHLFTLFQAFATPAQCDEFRSELLQGLGWGEAKNRLFQLLDNELGESRELSPVDRAPGGPGRHPAGRREKARKWRRRSSANCVRRWACVRSHRAGQYRRRKAAKSAFRQLPRRRRQLPLPSAGADGEQLLLSRTLPTANRRCGEQATAAGGEADVRVKA
jgi:tryptophanyl-tRNA synthetase